MDRADEFFTAIKAGDAHKVNELLDQAAALANVKDQNGLSAVLVAAYYNEPAIAQTLVERGASLNIFEAATLGRLDRVKQIIADQPNLANAYAEDGFQPLGLAAFFGHAEVVRFLLARDAEINSPSKNQMRVMPLHSAIAAKHTEVVRLLLEYGAEVNTPQADDFTPLHEAAQNGDPEVIQLLLDRGAEVNARKTDGKTPLALAIEYKHPDTALLLRQHGGIE